MATTSRTNPPTRTAYPDMLRPGRSLMIVTAPVAWVLEDMSRLLHCKKPTSMPDPKRGQSPGQATLQPALQKWVSRRAAGHRTTLQAESPSSRHVHPCPAAYQNCDAPRLDLN